MCSTKGPCHRGMECWLGVRDSPPEVTLSEVLSHLPPCVVPFCWACFVTEANGIHEGIDPQSLALCCFFTLELFPSLALCAREHTCYAVDSGIESYKLLKTITSPFGMPINAADSYPVATSTVQNLHKLPLYYIK